MHTEECEADIPVLDRGGPLQHGGNVPVHRVECHGVPVPGKAQGGLNGSERRICNNAEKATIVNDIM